jgi:CDP-paratose synthetase
MKKPSVLLTGATGFLGSHLLAALIQNDYPTTILIRSKSKTEKINHINGKYKSYIINNTTLEQIFEEQSIDCIIHTACNYGRTNTDISDVVDANLFFALNLLKCGLKYNVKSFINTDTFFNNGEALTNYLGDYVLSKKQFVEWIKFKSNKINIVNLKLHHVYGKNDNTSKFIPWFLIQLAENIPEIKLTECLVKRDFIYIDDVVNAYICILNNIDSINGFQEFEVGTGQSISLREFLIELKKIYTAENPDSITVLNFGAIKEQEGQIKEAFSDNSKLSQLGWSPCKSIRLCLTNLIS